MRTKVTLNTDIFHAVFMLNILIMSLLRNWSEKVKQNETHDDPALSFSKEHEEEPAERNYIFTNAFLCSVVLILFPPLQNNSFFRRSMQCS